MKCYFQNWITKWGAILLGAFCIAPTLIAQSVNVDEVDLIEHTPKIKGKSGEKVIARYKGVLYTYEYKGVAKGIIYETTNSPFDLAKIYPIMDHSCSADNNLWFFGPYGFVYEPKIGTLVDWLKIGKAYYDTFIYPEIGISPDDVFYCVNFMDLLYFPPDFTRYSMALLTFNYLRDSSDEFDQAFHNNPEVTKKWMAINIAWFLILKNKVADQFDFTNTANSKLRAKECCIRKPDIGINNSCTLIDESEEDENSNNANKESNIYKYKIKDFPIKVSINIGVRAKSNVEGGLREIDAKMDNKQEEK